MTAAIAALIMLKGRDAMLSAWETFALRRYQKGREEQAKVIAKFEEERKALAKRIAELEKERKEQV